MTQISAEQILEVFESADLRPTRPRRALIEQILLWDHADKDFTCEELWHAVQIHTPWVGRATAFRTVQLLLEFGFLDRVKFADGTERYHVVVPGTHHHHLTCECCHHVVEVDTCLGVDTLNKIAADSGFTISGHRLELFGRCPSCQ
jgi:Fur family transcriptional regulator, ferric uptake regulator